jgi:hypothetical protein
VGEQGISLRLMAALRKTAAIARLSHDCQLHQRDQRYHRPCAATYNAGGDAEPTPASTRSLEHAKRWSSLQCGPILGERGLESTVQFTSLSHRMRPKDHIA